MKNKSHNLLMAILVGTGFSMVDLQAQNAFFDAGDLILYFQKPGDEDTLYVGLGSAATLYRGSAAGPTADRQALDIVNINAALTTAYGAGWASDPDIYAGLAGCRSSSTGIQVFDGDQTRSLYISRARAAVGTLGAANSIPWDLNQLQSQTTGAGQIIGSSSNDFETNYLTQVAIAPASTSKIPVDNPISNPALGLQGTAFKAFTGGVQQRGSAASFGTFGPAGSVEFALDLNRIVPRNDADTTGEVSGVKLVGSYEGTVVVGTDGNVSFITQGVAGSTYDNWIGSFNPPLTNPDDHLATADPDNDGLNNLAEFVLNGNPSVSNQAIAPVLDASGENFVFTFARRDDSVAIAPVIFQYGGTLASWTDVAIPTETGPVGAATVTVTPGDAVTDAISVSVPKSEAVGGKLFGRIKIVK
jgi:hypothetical protein